MLGMLSYEPMRAGPTGERILGGLVLGLAVSCRSKAGLRQSKTQPHDGPLLHRLANQANSQNVSRSGFRRQSWLGGFLVILSGEKTGFAIDGLGREGRELHCQSVVWIIRVVLSQRRVFT